MPRLAAKGHLLFVAYHFPPHRTVASLRTWNLAKQLALRGWQLTVLTLDPGLWLRREEAHPIVLGDIPPNLHLLRVRPHLRWVNTDEWHQRTPRLNWWLGAPLRRLFRLFAIELSVGWLPSALCACPRLDANPPDLILATGGPFLSSFVLARRLALRFNAPYALDYRDLWTTGNPHTHSPFLAWQRPLERAIGRRAAAIVTVSHGLAQNLHKCLALHQPVHVITNGYDPDLLSTVQPIQFPEPAIVYAGTLYPPLRTLTPLFAALKLLDHPNLQWSFHYYGSSTSLVAKDVQRFHLVHRTHLHGEVPHAVAAAAAKGAHCAVVVVSTARRANANEAGILTGKLFELLGLGAEVLLIAPEDSEARLLLNGRAQAFCGDEIPGIASFLRSVVTQPRTTYAPAIQYSWCHLADLYDNVLTQQNFP